MKKFVAFAVAAAVAAGSTAAMAQCASCQQNQVFNQPVYSAPVYSAPAAPMYSAPVQSEVVYSAPAIESAPMVQSAPAMPMSYESAPVVSSGCGNCGCCAQGSMVVDGGSMGMTYGGASTLTVGSVINGETVVSVGETVVVESGEASQPAEGSDAGNAIEGAVEPTSDGGEIVAPPKEDEGEITPPAPDEAAASEATEGDA